MVKKNRCFPLEAFSFFFPIVSTALSHTVSEYLPATLARLFQQVTEAKPGAVLHPGAREGCICRSKAGFIVLKVIAVISWRVKQQHVLSKLA